MALIDLPVFGEVRTIKLPGDVVEVALDEAGKRKLEALNRALSVSKSSNKSTYTSWDRHSIFSVGEGSDVEFKAMLSYWISLLILSSSPGDSLCPYVFTLVIKLAKGERFALVSIYLVRFSIDCMSALVIL